MRFAERATIVEVAPRDGLQSLTRVYPTEVKVALVELLAETGLPKIEVTGFARPDVIPQLADGEDVFRRIRRRDGVVYRALCPNRRGAERAVDAGADELVALVTASETYTRKNANMTVAEALDHAAAVARIGHAAGKPIVAAIGVCTFCPYEGELPHVRTLELVERLVDEGFGDVYLATSVGVDAPRAVHRLCALVRERWPGLRLGVHLHDTNGMALANALAAMDAGATIFEGSICGIGGGIRMPAGMAPFGNVATEDLAHMFSEMGVETGVDLRRVIEAARRARDLLGLEQTFGRASNGATKADVLALTRGQSP